MKKILIVLFVLVGIASSVNYLPETALKANASLSMDETYPGNFEMWNGNINNATYINTTWMNTVSMGPTTMYGDLNMTDHDIVDANMTDTDYIASTIALGDITFADGYYMRNGSYVINVCDWGAVGDGITNDTAAIQGAIDAAEATTAGDVGSYRILYMPDGKYNIDGILRIKENYVKLVGSGTVTTTLNFSAGSYLYIAPDSGTIFETVLKDFSINGHDIATNGIVVETASQIYFENVDVEHIDGAAISLDTVGLSRMDRCIVAHSDTGLHLDTCSDLITTRLNSYANNICVDVEGNNLLLNFDKCWFEDFSSAFVLNCTSHNAKINQGTVQNSYFLSANNNSLVLDCISPADTYYVSLRPFGFYNNNILFTGVLTPYVFSFDVDAANGDTYFFIVARDNTISCSGTKTALIFSDLPADNDLQFRLEGNAITYTFSTILSNEGYLVGHTGNHAIPTDGNQIVGPMLIESYTPASASASGQVGQIAWDANYIYVYVSANNWRRAPIATW